jgi:hypothetical protein
LKSAYPKFLRLITDFQMMSVGEAANQIDWNKVKIISL